MDSTHVAVGAVTGLLASTLVYLSHWPLQPLDAQTAASIAGLLVAAVGAAVRFYQWRRSTPRPVTDRIVGAS
jgi:hypothetical protein